MNELSRNEPHALISTILLFGLFGGGFAIFYFMGRTFLTIDMVALYIIVAAALAFGIHYFFIKRMKRYLIEMLMYCLLGWGLLTVGLLLTLNFFVHSAPVTDRYVLKDNKSLDLTMAPSSVEIMVDDPAFDDFNYLLTFHEDEIKAGQYANEAIITEATGILGYKIILSKELR